MSHLKQIGDSIVGKTNNFQGRQGNIVSISGPTNKRRFQAKWIDSEICEVSTRAIEIYTGLAVDPPISHEDYGSQMEVDNSNISSDDEDLKSEVSSIDSILDGAAGIDGDDG